MAILLRQGKYWSRAIEGVLTSSVRLDVRQESWVEHASLGLEVHELEAYK